MAKSKNWYINIERFGSISLFFTPFSDLVNAFLARSGLYFFCFYFKRGSLKSLLCAVDDSLTKWM